MRQSRAGKGFAWVRRHPILWTAVVPLLLNLLYAIYHGILGVLNQSVWFASMCAYYSVLSAMRFSAVLCGRRGRSAAGIARAYFVMRLTGALMIVWSLLLTGVIYVSLSQNIATKYDEILMITIAAYTFYKVAMAITRAVKAKKNPAPLERVLRGIRYAEVAASVLTLQRSMLASFGSMTEPKAHLLNRISGAAVCLFVLCLGVAMVVRGIRKEEISLWQSRNW